MSALFTKPFKNECKLKRKMKKWEEKKVAHLRKKSFRNAKYTMGPNTA